MTCRRRDFTALLLFLGVVLFAMWIVGRDDAAEETTIVERAGETGRSAPTLRGSLGDDPPPPSGPPPRRWWLEGAVRSIEPGVATACVEVRWWPSRPGDSSAKPDRVYRSDPLDVSGDAVSFRLSGDEDGFVLAFLTANGRTWPFGAEASRVGHEVEVGHSLALGTGVVGTWLFEGRVVDAEGEPVPGIELAVHDPVREWHQKVRSDDEGRFLLGGFESTPVRVDYLNGRTHGWTPEFAGFLRREVHLDEGPVEIRLERYPVIHLVGRVEGAAADLPCVPGYVRARGLDAQHPLWVVRKGISPVDGLRLAPGRWHLEAHFDGVGAAHVSTPDLAVDQVVELEVPIRIRDDHALLEIRFDRPRPGTEKPVYCAVGAIWRAEGLGRTGPQRSARGAGLLLPVRPGDLEIQGAIRIGEAVYFSERTPVRVGKGEHAVVRLPTVRAGAVVVPRRSIRQRGRAWVEAPEGVFTAHGVLVCPSFRLGWQQGARGVTTLWMPSGRYAIHRKMAQAEAAERLDVDVKTGRVLRLEEGPEGLRVVRDG